MKFFLEESDLEEVKPLEKPSEDSGIVINPTVGKRGEEKSDLIKEIVANDTLSIGPTKAAAIHGVPTSSASKYADGKDIGDPEIQANVLSKKYQIQDKAVTMLMNTLGLLGDDMPTMKVREKIHLATTLSGIVDRIEGKEDGNGKSVHLHLYGPHQKKETDYKIIDVG